MKKQIFYVMLFLMNVHFTYSFAGKMCRTGINTIAAVGLYYMGKTSYDTIKYHFGSPDFRITSDINQADRSLRAIKKEVAQGPTLTQEERNTFLAALEKIQAEKIDPTKAMLEDNIKKG